MPEFTCTTCSATFTLSQATLDRYPGWTPKQCGRCRNGGSRAKSSGNRGAKAGSRAYATTTLIEENLTTAEVLAKYTKGPTDGVFTDGSAAPNPGPGGWGAVYVVDNEVVGLDHGHEGQTTNNRMELRALIAGYDLIPEATPTTMYSDSRLVVQTINEWAEGWERRGWKRKTGPIANLDLVQEAFERSKERPDVKLEWIRAHNGARWNEFADSLSTAYLRDVV